jgi:outer membrane biogenesis lipoprotein LolB
MGRVARAVALVAAAVLAACNGSGPAPAPADSRESQRAPSGLPDAYRHPPR